MKQKIKIVHCMSALSGGVGKMIMYYFDRLDPEEYSVHIVTQDLVSQEYVKLYESRGYQIHLVPSKKEGILKNFRALRQVFRKEKFDIVHCHMTVTNVFPLLAALTGGIRVRISHSHLAEKLNWMEKGMAFGSSVFATDRMACGEMAGKSIFGKRSFTLVNNAVDTEKYRFDPVVREQQRILLDFQGKHVFCHVGRFTEQKNHRFLLDVFRLISDRDRKARLLLVGEGELQREMQAYAAQLGLEQEILFTGLIEDVNAKLQAADVFLLPSRYEGLCVAAIEAQASGIPCLFADTVDVKTAINDNVAFLPVDDAGRWAAEALKMLERKRTGDCNAVIRAGYDIGTEAYRLDQFYKNAVRRSAGK